MHISIELLLLKLEVLVQLLDIAGIIGLAVLLGSLIWMVVRAANFDSLLPPLAGIVVSLVLIGGGLACRPVSEKAAGLTVAAWLSGAFDTDLEELRKSAGEQLAGPKEANKSIRETLGDIKEQLSFGNLKSAVLGFLGKGEPDEGASPEPEPPPEPEPTPSEAAEQLVSALAAATAAVPAPSGADGAIP